MRREDAGMQTVVFGELLELLPIFVATSGRTWQGKWNARLGRTLHTGMQHGVGKLFRTEPRQFLTIVVVKREIQANAFDVDADALGGVVAQGDLDGEDSSSVRRLLRKRLLVALGGEPRVSGNGQTFVGIERGGGDGLGSGLLLRACWRPG